MKRNECRDMKFKFYHIRKGKGRTKITTGYAITHYRTYRLTRWRKKNEQL